MTIENPCYKIPTSNIQYICKGLIPKHISPCKLLNGRIHRCRNQKRSQNSHEGCRNKEYAMWCRLKVIVIMTSYVK